MDEPRERPVEIPIGSASLQADLVAHRPTRGVVLFAHGSGSGRRSPRNRFVAEGLHAGGFATLLVDLLTVEEARIDDATRHLRFDVDLLARRLAVAIAWLAEEPGVANLPLGLYGASTGAAAALIAAADHPREVAAVVSRGGRPDLAAAALSRVRAPTLLIVGRCDPQVIALNERAQRAMTATTRLSLVPGAGHLFEEPGALDQVVALARAWYAEHLRRP